MTIDAAVGEHSMNMGAPDAYKLIDDAQSAAMELSKRQYLSCT
jgi:hypothetical protein